MIAVVVEEPGESGSCHHCMPEGMKEYVKKNGYHFTDSLAEFASSLMKNADKSKHTWSVDDVRTAFASKGYIKAADRTWGDITYIANMAYADFYGMLLKTEADCLQYALAEINDVDGYEGKEFNRWIADANMLGVQIDWSGMI